MAKGKKAAKEEVQVQQPPAQKLDTAQEINALRAAHQFFSNFDRVPGNYTNAWSQALDAIAVVANSLIAKSEESQKVAETAGSNGAAPQSVQ